MIRIQPLAGTLYPKETNRATIACNDYLRLPPYRRSLRKLIAKYNREFERTGSACNVTTFSINTLFRWSADYQWVQRAREYDWRH